MPSTHLPPRPPFPTSTPDPSIIPRFAATPLPRSSETTTTSGATPVATAEPDIFISLRFNEARPAGNALQAALEAKNMSVFLCDVAPGENLASAVVNALTHCKLAVIFGTETYGQETASSFSTFQELRYIVDKKKPFFLLKMCDAFVEARTDFHLPSTISYYPWRPATEQERNAAPPDLIEQIVSRLETVLHGPRRSVAAVPAPGVHSVAAAASNGPRSSSGGAAVLELGAWLASITLTEAEPVLRALGAVDAHDVKLGFADGDITRQHLIDGGVKPLRAKRLERLAREVCFWEGGGRAEKQAHSTSDAISRCCDSYAPFFLLNLNNRSPSEVHLVAFGK